MRILKSKINYDQHFMVDNKILDEIVDVADIKNEDVILEIGVGKGVLTKLLAKSSGKVLGIELDDTMKKHLLKLPENVIVVFGNALNIMGKLKYNKIVSNLPYAITEPLMKHMVKQPCDLVVLVIGKNFCKILFSEGKWNFIVGLFYDVKKIRDISPGAFFPPPRTDSSLVKFKKRTKELTLSELFIREFVLQGNKKVKNALIESFFQVNGFTKTHSKKIISELNIPENYLNKLVDLLPNREFMELVKILNSYESNS